MIAYSEEFNFEDVFMSRKNREKDKKREQRIYEEYKRIKRVNSIPYRILIKLDTFLLNYCDCVSRCGHKDPSGTFLAMNLTLLSEFAFCYTILVPPAFCEYIAIVRTLAFLVFVGTLIKLCKMFKECNKIDNIFVTKSDKEDTKSV